MPRPRNYTQRKAQLVEQFGGGCQRCGYRRCHRALQFHHVDPIKNARRSSSAMLPEVEEHPGRFHLLCANCHFEEHERLHIERPRAYKACQFCGEDFEVDTNQSKTIRERTAFCSLTCYRRQHRHLASDPQAVMDRIMSHVTIVGDCWIWNGSLANGSPVVNVVQDTDERGRQGRPRSARRVLAEFAAPGVKFPAQLKASCGNRLCIAPNHSIHRQLPV
jgi:hypothetical protein